MALELETRADTNLLATQRQPWQRYLAEFLGTFIIVFAGCGAVISNTMSGGSISPVGISLTFGFAVATMIYALGPISAAHFNPAVTLAFAIARRFPWHCVPAYATAQVAGGICASLLHRLLFGEHLAGQAHYGATISVIPTGATVCFEALMTFILMLVIMAVATDRHVPGAVPGLAIGLTVTACALLGGAATGASMNPARSIGPALLNGGPALSVLPLYLIGPAIGAITGAFCYQLLRDGALNVHAPPADLEESLHQKPGLSRHGLSRN